MKTEIVIFVVKHPYKTGYALKHNQLRGWKGITGDTWSWFKYKSDAVERATELMKSYN